MDCLKDNTQELECKESVEVVNGEVLDKSLRITSSTPGIDFSGVLDQVLQCLNIEGIIQGIQKGTRYVVQIPKELISDFNTNKLHMMQNSKTGIKWPELVQIEESGKTKIVSPLPCVEEAFIQGNPFSEIANSYHNYYMAQQLQQMSQTLEKTLSVVVKIEKGQSNDRTGLLNSGRQQILLALSQKDVTSRTNAIQLGIKTLSDAQGQIAESFRQRVNDFKEIPQSQIKQCFKVFINGKYLSSKDEEFDRIQDDYDLYLKSTAMIATAYVAMGETENARRVFDFALHNMGQIDFSKVKTIEYTHNKDEIEPLYDDAIAYLKSEEKKCIASAGCPSQIELEVSGVELMEAIEREQEKRETSKPKRTPRCKSVPKEKVEP